VADKADERVESGGNTGRLLTTHARLDQLLDPFRRAKAERTLCRHAHAWRTARMRLQRRAFSEPGAGPGFRECAQARSLLGARGEEAVRGVSRNGRLSTLDQ
jgi:hypothetical protein